MSFWCYCRLTAVADLSDKLQLQQLHERVAILSRLTAGTTDSTMSFRIRSVYSQPCTIEVCIVIGIPMGMGFPSHGNGSGNGTNVMGMGMAHNVRDVLFCLATCSDR